MKLTFFLSTILILVITFIYYITGYRSAFEADQQCHYEMRSITSEGQDLGCDHDLETRQWILFQLSNNNEPAIVLKRFRY